MAAIDEMWNEIRESLKTYADKYPAIIDFRDFFNAMQKSMTYTEFYNHFNKIIQLRDIVFTVLDLPRIYALRMLMREYMAARRDAGDGLDTTTKAAAPQVALKKEEETPQATHDTTSVVSADENVVYDVARGDILSLLAQLRHVALEA